MTSALSLLSSSVSQPASRIARSEGRQDPARVPITDAGGLIASDPHVEYSAPADTMRNPDHTGGATADLVPVTNPQ